MPIETAEFTFADHFKEWCELYDEAHVDVDSYRELKAALINAFPMIRKAITEKDAQIAELNDERAADGEAIRNLQDMVQSANERIEAAEKLVVQAEEYFIVAAQRIDELQSQLSALQRAAREYMCEHECETPDCESFQALLDLLP